MSKTSNKMNKNHHINQIANKNINKFHKNDQNKGENEHK